MKNPWLQSMLSLLSAGGFFTLAALIPAGAVGLTMVASACLGFAIGRPIPAGGGALGPTERNPEIAPPAGDPK